MSLHTVPLSRAPPSPYHDPIEKSLPRTHTQRRKAEPLQARPHSPIKQRPPRPPPQSFIRQRPPKHTPTPNPHLPPALPAAAPIAPTSRRGERGGEGGGPSAPSTPHPPLHGRGTERGHGAANQRRRRGSVICFRSRTQWSRRLRDIDGWEHWEHWEPDPPNVGTKNWSEAGAADGFIGG